MVLDVLTYHGQCSSKCLSFPKKWHTDHYTHDIMLLWTLWARRSNYSRCTGKTSACQKGKSIKNSGAFYLNATPKQSSGVGYTETPLSKVRMDAAWSSHRERSSAPLDSGENWMPLLDVLLQPFTKRSPKSIRQALSGA